MITPTAPIAQPAISNYDLKSLSIDFAVTPHMVNIVYFGEVGASQVTPDQVITIPLSVLMAKSGATFKLKVYQAVSDAIGLVAPTIV